MRHAIRRFRINARTVHCTCTVYTDEQPSRSGLACTHTTLGSAWCYRHETGVVQYAVEHPRRKPTRLLYCLVCCHRGCPHTRVCSTPRTRAPRLVYSCGGCLLPVPDLRDLLYVPGPSRTARRAVPHRFATHILNKVESRELYYLYASAGEGTRYDTHSSAARARDAGDAGG